MSETLPSTESELTSVSAFYYTVAQYNIILESGIKTEIIDKRDIFPIPHTPAWCRGMISLRGKLIPVVNLHHVLGDTEQGKSQWLLIIEKSPFPQLAISIDQLPMQQAINDESFKLLFEEPEESTRWLEATASVENKTFYKVNHSTLFEQLIQLNETSRGDFTERPPTHNPDSLGNDA